MRVYSSRNIAIGDVILGSDGDWWKVTSIIMRPDGFPEFYAQRQGKGRPQPLRNPNGKGIRER
jgi:hypothetical protein